MGSLGAFFCAEFDEIGEVIDHRLRATDRSNCLVVVVFANAKSDLFQKHIGPYIGERHYRSADSVEFVFPGYRGLGDPKQHKFKPEMYDDAFQDEVFVRATAAFQAQSAWPASHNGRRLAQNVFKSFDEIEAARERSK